MVSQLQQLFNPCNQWYMEKIIVEGCNFNCSLSRLFTNVGKPISMWHLTIQRLHSSMYATSSIPIKSTDQKVIGKSQNRNESLYTSPVFIWEPTGSKPGITFNTYRSSLVHYVCFHQNIPERINVNTMTVRKILSSSALVALSFQPGLLFTRLGVQIPQAHNR